MSYDEYLADRVRQSLTRSLIAFDEKRMMGGLCVMVDGKMCVGIVDSRLMVRLDPQEYDQALQQPGCKPMNFTGRAMRGFVFVDAEHLESAEQLEYWMRCALEFNPRAKSSKVSSRQAPTRSPRASTKKSSKGAKKSPRRE